MAGKPTLADDGSLNNAWGRGFIRQVPLQVLVLYLGSLTEGMLDGFMAVVLPLYVADRFKDTLGIPVAVIAGVLLSLSGLADSILLPFAGSFSDRMLRRKRFIQFGRTLIFCTLVLFTVWPNFLFAATLRVLQGVGVALLLPSSLALISESMPQGMQASAMSLQTSLRVLGGLLGPILGGLAQAVIGYEGAFWIMAGAWLAASLLIAGLVRDVPVRGQKAEAVPKAAPGQASQAGWLTLRDMLLLSTVMFSVSYCAAMIGSLQNILNEQLNQTAVAFGIAYGATSFARIGLQVPVGYLVDRFRPKPFILAGLALMGLATLGIGYVNTTGGLIFFRVLQGLGMTLSMVPVLGMAASISGPQFRGRNMGISTSGFGLGASAGPLITGLLAGYFSLEISFVFSALLCALAMILVGTKVGSYSLRPGS